MGPQLPTPGGRISIYALSLFATAHALNRLFRSYRAKSRPIADAGPAARGSPDLGPAQPWMESWYPMCPH